ncbi:MAG TPA: hypothetical protein VHU87_10315 [Rhizomicrobium sp.]|nr:hypothetical protein [Rhizomicrobium sp.]
MTKESQRRAVDNQRKRMTERGQCRYEVRGLASDKILVRKFAEKLAARDADSAKLREQVQETIAPKPPSRGAIGRALRKAPHFPDDFDISREFTTGRDIEL